MCGDAGAGSLKKEIFIQRLSGAMNGIYGSDLDYIFGNMRFLSRSPSESYTYNTMTDMLTSDQWDEVAVKDAWYRARIAEFFMAAAQGPLIDGIRLCVHAAVGVDCEVMESWRFIDSYGLGQDVGRASSRQEVVVRPFKETLDPRERRLLRDMLDRITPLDTIITIDTQGLETSSPVPIRAIAADSVYFEVQKNVIGTDFLKSYPDPTVLVDSGALTLNPTELWPWNSLDGTPTLAPYAQFNMTQETSTCYLASGGSQSPIDSVVYGILSGSGEDSYVTSTTILHTLYCVGGTIDHPAQGPLADWGILARLDPNTWEGFTMFCSDTLPRSVSVSETEEALASQIKNSTGKFALLGTGLGAAVTSRIYLRLREGDLQDRRLI